MNRKHHIQQSLQLNIEQNLSYPNLEYVLLDYGSTDGLEKWIRSDMQEYIDKGILKYYRTSEPVFFDRSHSRNLMFKLATGDILCNIDADNYAGQGYASYINHIFNQEKEIYLVADTKKRIYFLRNAFGRFCIRKQDFELLGGLDENMKSYGSETLDLYERLNLAGKYEKIIENTQFLKTISHGDEERISNEFFIQSLEKIYIRHISIEESEILILYKNGQFERCLIEPDKVNTYLPAALIKDTLTKGTWEIQNDVLILSFATSTRKLHLQENILLENNNLNNCFYQITDQRFLLKIAKNYSFITNTEKLNTNKSSNNYFVNEGIYGQGNVIKNFTEELFVV